MVQVRPVVPADAPRWLALRQALWPEGSQENHAREIEEFLAGRLRMPLQVLVAEAGDDLAGFVELSIRPYAEGCETDRVAYLEGWYVAPRFRRRGVGRALVARAEAWGREQGCSEFASDALLDNTVSHAAHRALGFEDVVAIRCFRKPL
jgi:aminoglycoside 6'-N-acetyltransferase I